GSYSPDPVIVFHLCRRSITETFVSGVVPFRQFKKSPDILTMPLKSPPPSFPPRRPFSPRSAPLLRYILSPTRPPHPPPRLRRSRLNFLPQPPEIERPPVTDPPRGSYPSDQEGSAAPSSFPLPAPLSAPSRLPKHRRYDGHPAPSRTDSPGRS